MNMKETKESIDADRPKEPKKTKELLETKEPKEIKEIKELVDLKEIREPMDTKEAKEPKDLKRNRVLINTKETTKPMDIREIKEPMDMKISMETTEPTKPAEPMEPMKPMEPKSLVETITLYEEFRLIERNEGEVSIAWKGAHLILFFLAFVFGSFCTFCFHILMYMFDQKCVLNPKISLHQSLRHMVYDFFTVKGQSHHLNAEDDDNELVSKMPLDFMSTQWVDNSVCYLPTYVPLVSGLCGLIWTTMFLMFSSGTSNPTGMQRQWRALPPIFVFSVAMSSLCIYSSMMTREGLNELCVRLAEMTGSKSCTYTVNVATLAYQRRIRGVYQAIMLTIATAWLHTACWMLSALLTLVRVLLAVDFQLVRVQANLIGNIDRMLEKYEMHIRSISPDFTAYTDEFSKNDSKNSFEETETEEEKEKPLFFREGEVMFVSKLTEQTSILSLVPEEQYRLAKQLAIATIAPEHQFVVRLLYQILDEISLPESITSISQETPTEHLAGTKLQRQFGQAHMVLPSSSYTQNEYLGKKQAKELGKPVKQKLLNLMEPDELTKKVRAYNSSFNLTTEMKNILETNEDDAPSTSSTKPPVRSVLKRATKSVQTAGSHKVQILDPVQVVKLDDAESETESEVENEKSDDTESDKPKSKEDKDTQTNKEKQD